MRCLARSSCLAAARVVLLCTVAAWICLVAHRPATAPMSPLPTAVAPGGPVMGLTPAPIPGPPRLPPPARPAGGGAAGAGAQRPAAVEVPTDLLAAMALGTTVAGVGLLRLTRRHGRAAPRRANRRSNNGRADDAGVVAQLRGPYWRRDVDRRQPLGRVLTDC